MDQKILVISGKKQSGKTSLANFLYGYELFRHKEIKYFDINDDGQLLLNTTYLDVNGKEAEGVGILDITRTDLDFIELAVEKIWPHIKLYNFADRLKQVISVIFGIPLEIFNGTNEQKNTFSNIKWSSLKFALDPSIEKPWDEYMTYREIAQFFGTNVCRRIYSECWVEACYRDIIQENSPFAIIADARFPNELDYMKQHGAKVVRLLRNVNPEDKHESELALDSYSVDKYDLIIDNNNMTIKEKNIALLNKLLEWGWVTNI